ncbi:MAG: AsmA-like C-terminal region-containing protein [Silvanigrellaceae bacterium]|nr:AsmA-like C-terminal region-containing protein [Silvanigrellaceae bacterium]
MKKMTLKITVFFSLLILAIIFITLSYDLEKLKPHIQMLAKEHLSCDIDYSKIKVGNMFTNQQIEFSDFKLKKILPTQNKTILLEAKTLAINIGFNTKSIQYYWQFLTHFSSQKILETTYIKKLFFSDTAATIFFSQDETNDHFINFKNADILIQDIDVKKNIPLKTRSSFAAYHRNLKFTGVIDLNIILSPLYENETWQDVVLQGRFDFFDVILNKDKFFETLVLLGNLNVKDFSYQGKMAVTKLNLVKFYDIFLQPQKNLVEGQLSAQLDFSGAGEKQEDFLKFFKGDGTFSLEQGKINIQNILDFALENINEALKKEKALDFLNIKLLSFPQISKQHALEKVQGEFKIKNGTLTFKNTYRDVNGFYFIDVSLDANSTLKGNILFEMSKALKKQIVDENKDFELLFDEQGKLQFTVQLSGSSAQPHYHLDLHPLKMRIIKKAPKILENMGKNFIKKLFKFD